MSTTSTIAYLIGVPDRHFGLEYEEAVFNDLEENASAKTIRCLSIVRNTLLMQNGAISNHIRRNLYSNIDEFIEPDILDFLETRGIQLVQPCPNVNDIIVRLNQLIPEWLEECRGLVDVKWEYVRRLFMMGRNIAQVVDDMHLRKRSYPFQCYINWPVWDSRAYPGGRFGNVLMNDETFIRLLYQVNGAEPPENRTEIKEFLEKATSVVLAVDCENSEPYRLCSAMNRLKAEDPQSFSKIRKTVLFDDVHTTDTWRVLSDFLPVPVEHILTHRVNEHKSLVDIQLTAGVAREHYGSGVDSFLLASSDSDYWGLIKSLPTARFLVMAEREKVGECMRKALKAEGIGLSLMGDEGTEEVRKVALDAGIRKRMAELDLEGIVADTIEKMRIGGNVDDILGRLAIRDGRVVLF